MATKNQIPEDAEKAAAAAPPASAAEPVTVAPNEPYPEGKPQDPEAGFEAAHGYRR